MIRLPLPESFAKTLRAMHRSRDSRLSQTLALAVGKGWTQQQLGEALGVTRQAISLRIAAHEPGGADLLPPIPSPPSPPPPPAPPPPKPALSGEDIAELRRLHEVGKTVNGATPVDAVERRASEQLSAFVAALIAHGIPLVRIAEAIGVSRMGLVWRLGRHGYRPLPPSLADQMYRNRCTRAEPMSGAT